MFGQKKIMVIWVSARQLTILGGRVVVPEHILFPPTVIANLEIIDRDGLYALVKEWAAQHPAVDTEVVWVIGHDVCFDAVLADSAKQEWDSQVVRFLDLLPFEEVESRIYSGSPDSRIIAINKDLYDSIKQGFALQGYMTRSEIPALMLGQVGQGTDLDPTVAAYVLKNLDALEKNRLVTDEVETVESTSPPSETKPKSQLPLLIGVFAVLLGVMIFMLLRMNS